MKIRDRLPLLAVLCCFSALLLLPEVSAQAARDAMLLCAQTLIPSLFPFFVLSSLLIACGASELLSALLSPLMRPLFGLSGTGAAALALGLCGGYPVGARTAAELVENGVLSRDEGERLLAFCNNAGPGFLLGVCGAGLFSSSRAGHRIQGCQVDRRYGAVVLRGTRRPARAAPCRRGLRGGGIYRAHGGHAVFLRAPAPTPRTVHRRHSVCGAAARQLAFHLGF